MPKRTWRPIRHRPRTLGQILSRYVAICKTFYLLHFFISVNLPTVHHDFWHSCVVVMSIHYEFLYLETVFQYSPKGTYTCALHIIVKMAFSTLLVRKEQASFSCYQKKVQNIITSSSIKPFYCLRHASKNCPYNFQFIKGKNTTSFRVFLFEAWHTVIILNKSEIPPLEQIFHRSNRIRGNY